MDEPDALRSQIEELWSEGLNVPEMARQLGTTSQVVYTEMAMMREAGYDLPYRRSPAVPHVEEEPREG